MNLRVLGRKTSSMHPKIPVESVEQTAWVC